MSKSFSNDYERYDIFDEDLERNSKSLEVFDTEISGIQSPPQRLRVNNDTSLESMRSTPKNKASKYQYSFLNTSQRVLDRSVSRTAETAPLKSTPLAKFRRVATPGNKVVKTQTTGPQTPVTNYESSHEAHKLYSSIHKNIDEALLLVENLGSKHGTPVQSRFTSPRMRSASIVSHGGGMGNASVSSSDSAYGRVDGKANGGPRTASQIAPQKQFDFEKVQKSFQKRKEAGEKGQNLERAKRPAKAPSFPSSAVSTVSRAPKRNYDDARDLMDWPLSKWNEFASRIRHAKESGDHASVSSRDFMIEFEIRDKTELKLRIKALTMYKKDQRKRRKLN